MYNGRIGCERFGLTCSAQVIQATEQKVKNKTGKIGPEKSRTVLQQLSVQEQLFWCNDTKSDRSQGAGLHSLFPPAQQFLRLTYPPLY